MKGNSRRSKKPVRRAAPLRLLFVGEGPHDVGRDEDGQRGGALAGLLHALLVEPGSALDESEWPFEVIPRVWTTLAPQLPGPNRRPRSFEGAMKLSNDARRVQAAILLAHTEGLDAVAVMRDCETRDRDDLGEQLRLGRDQYAAAEEGLHPAVVIATPARSHETWLLADEDAVEAELGSVGRYRFTRDAEDRPDATTLKQHLRHHCDRCHREEFDVRRELAFRGRPDAIERRCPKQYKPFRTDVLKELATRYREKIASFLRERHDASD